MGFVNVFVILSAVRISDAFKSLSRKSTSDHQKVVTSVKQEVRSKARVVFSENQRTCNTADSMSNGADGATSKRRIHNETHQVPDKPSRPLALLALVSVPIVWGTYAPVVRGLNFIDPPIPGFVFSTAYFLVASVSTWSLIIFDNNKNLSNNTKAPIFKEDFQATCLAAAELGSYIFLGSTLQIVGLQTVPSDRAGFLIQLTTLLVPLVQALVEGDFFSVTLRTWFACFLALSGIVVMGLDTDTDVLALSPSSIRGGLSQGDTLILLAAFMYTMHVVRLGRWASRVPPLRLVAAKATFETLISVLVTTALVVYAQTAGDNVPNDAFLSFFQSCGRDVLNFFTSIQERFSAGTLSPASVQLAAFAIVWSGCISTAFVNYAQSYGQRVIKPSDANLIYSAQPLFTAIFAYVLLGENNMEANGVIGAVLLGSAIYLVASQPTAVTNQE